MASGESKGGDVSDAGHLIAVIGDEDTVTGFLLAGIGHRDAAGTNYLVVDSDTPLAKLEDTFSAFLARTDVGIILINQHVANDVRHLIRGHTKPVPTVVEIPSKDSPYDPSKDALMARVTKMLGEA